MRKRIWRMSEDKFDNQTPKLSLSADSLEFSVRAGETFAGSFSFKAAEGCGLKGIVYCSHPYVVVSNPVFTGSEISINFSLRGKHYKEGDQLSGYFTIVYNGGERRLPFVVNFNEEVLTCSKGDIKSLKDFAELAKANWVEANQLFYSSAFARFAEKLSTEDRLLYAGYRKATPTAANLEEFLVSCGLKSRVEFFVDESQRDFYLVKENRKEALQINKSTWGNISLRITTDAPFLSVEQELITTDYFLGSQCSLDYYIHADRLHQGKNFGKIKISGNGLEREVAIMATARGEGEEFDWLHRQKNRELSLLTQAYEDYRFRRITTGEWCKRSLQILDDLARLDGDSSWLQLIRVQCFIINQQRQEALWLIQDLKLEIQDKSSVEWAYLLYLCTLIEKEESYVDRLTKDIEMIFRLHDDDARIFWFLQFLRKEYSSNQARRLQDIEQWIIAGNASPFLYIEAYGILVQNAYLLREFTPVKLQILYWAARKGLLQKEISAQVGQVLGAHNKFDSKLWFLAQKAYECSETEDFFRNIITYMLRCELHGAEYLQWYEKAIDEDLRVSGLYEAYMMSLPEQSTSPLPARVTLYFRYSCSLPYPVKALLYANVIVHRRQNPQIYQQYLRSIELFAIEQMKQGHVNDNLAIVYQNVVEMGVVDESMAKAMAGLIYTKKLICIAPDITRVYVYQEQYELPIVVPMKDSAAYLPIISSHFRIFLERADGMLLSDPYNYHLQRVFYPERFLPKLKALAPLALPFILADFEEKYETASFGPEDVGRLEEFLHSSLVSKSYVYKLHKPILALLRAQVREDLLKDYFLTEVDYSALDPSTMGYVVELYLENGLYEQALPLIEEYGLLLPENLLLPMCSALVERHCSEENELLLDICAYVVAGGVSSPALCAYLASHRAGETGWMIGLWHYCKNHELRVVDLEESILFQALYSESHLDEIMPIFSSYMTKGKDRMLMEAFINYWSHVYLLESAKVPDELFTVLAYFFEKEQRLRESCNLAYMKFLSGVNLLSDREIGILDNLLQYYITRNVYFGFYKNLDQQLLIKYHLYDKQFVEYRGNPGSEIIITYQMGDAPIVEDEMVEIYGGIYVKQFVMFYGDSLKYEIYDETAGTGEPAHKGEIVLTDQLAEGKGDRFDRINRMQNALMYGETNVLAHELKQYQGLDSVSKRLFTTI